MSDNSDDDLLQDVGLSFSNRNKKRKEDQKREALLNIVDYSVEEDLQRRHRQERLNHVLIDHTNVVEQAEGNLESARIKQEANEENFLIPDEQKAVTSAKEISGFDRLGTRPGVLKAIARTPLPDLQSILNDARDRKLKKYVQAKINIDMLPAALEQGNLSHKFDLSNEVVEWLWRSAIDYESECRDGAFATLREYFSIRTEKQVSLNDMMRQWEDWFESRGTKAVDFPDRDAQDCLLDIHNWLMLWVTLIEHASNLTDLNGANVADLVVSLAKIPLDVLFYEHNHNRMASSWCQTISLLLKELRSRNKNNVEWDEWVVRTASRIIGMDIDPAPCGSEDADDKACLLSKSLLVKAFISADVDFGSRLYELALCRFLGIDDWESEISALLASGPDWLLAKYKAAESTGSWRLLAYTYCTFLAIETRGEEIKRNPPRLLACVKLIQSFVSIGLLSGSDSKENLLSNPDFVTWLSLLEVQVSSLTKFVTRCSTQAHFRRAEVGLLCLKSWINWHKSVTALPESTQVQSSLSDWLQN